MSTENNLDLEDQDYTDNEDYDSEQDDDSSDLDSHLDDNDQHDDDDNESHLSEDQSSDSESSDDEESGTDEEREAIRARRREERKERKLLQRQREQSLRQELAARDAVINQMQQQLATLTGKSNQSEIAQLDAAIKQCVDAHQYFKSQIEEGTKVGDGKIVADATEKMIQARQAAEHYSNIKKQFIASQNRPPPTDTQVQILARDWISRNKWYDPQCRDVKSKMARVIDDSLVSEGYNPATPLYWEELDRRCNTLLQNNNVTGSRKGIQLNNGDGKSPQSQSRQKPKSVVAGSSRDSAVPPKEGSYKLSAERRKALEDAGLWADPKARAAAIKQYQDYDKQNKVRS